MTGPEPRQDPPGPAPQDALAAFRAWLTAFPRDAHPHWWDLEERRQVDRRLVPLRTRVRGLGLG